MKLLGLYGASGFGREVMPIVRQQYSGSPDTKLVFIDDSVPEAMVNGHQCMNFERFNSFEAEERAALICIGNGSIRRNLARKCSEAGVDFFSATSRTSTLMDEVSIGDGYILCPYVTITSNIRIGRHFHANLYSYVAHDCVIGDFVTFAPSVKCNGNVHIEDNVYVGTGAVIRQGEPGKPLVIGEGSTIGMGAVVTKSVPPGTVVVGNPAKPLVKD